MTTKSLFYVVVFSSIVSISPAQKCYFIESNIALEAMEEVSSYHKDTRNNLKAWYCVMYNPNTTKIFDTQLHKPYLLNCAYLLIRSP